MTNTVMVQGEIERFLRSSEPEVLCVAGDWGVGKTYTWQIWLDRVRTARQVGLTRYSYVSLFGINSLESLKQSIFENLEFLVPEGETSFERMKGVANKSFQQGKKLTGALSAIPIVGDALAKITQPFVFSLIRNQLICIDDLERRGEGLSVKDVLGTISFLREQRGCKIVLLLNESKLADVSNAAEHFRDYFEKVIDAKVVFAPTSEEAVAIAFPDSDEESKLIAKYSVKLGIKNIRVLKKIARLFRIVEPTLKGLDQRILEQAIHSLVIFGWSKFDSGASPPSLAYLKTNSISRYMSRSREGELTEQHKRWNNIIAGYQLSNVDDFDLTLMRFVEEGILDFELVRSEANRQAEKIRSGDLAGSFRASFEPLHNSFNSNENEVRDSLVLGFKKNFSIASLSDLDAVATILLRLNMNAKAEELIKFAVDNAADDFWRFEDLFGRPLQNDQLKELVRQKEEKRKPKLDFENDFLEIVQRIDQDRIAELAKQPIEAFVQLFEAKTGDERKHLILAALEFRRIMNASEGMLEVARKTEEALIAIGKKSPLNALRIERFGIKMPT